MRKKKKSKVKDVSKESAKATTKNSQVEKEEENPFDFGGLPDRELKKNLGCG